MERGSFKPHLPPGYDHAAEDLAYAQDPAALLPGHRMKLLVDGDQAFPEMLDTIKSAETSVHLETYILANDRIGQLFGDALAERARAGVAVRAMYDSLGSLGLPDDYVARLRTAGVQTVEFGPLSLWRHRRKWTRRDHRKMIIVDGRIGFVGGINIGDDYAPRDVGGSGWRDTHLRLEGPTVVDLEHMFRDVWHRQGGESYPPHAREASESVASADTTFASAVGTDLRGRRSAIRRHYLHAIRRAKHHIYIANAYFVPDRTIRRALRRASDRGVDVHVIVSMASDVKAVQYAGEYTYTHLMRHGVHIQGWHESHMHSKVAVIDDVWATVGSYNLDYISLFMNLEVIAVIVSRKFGADMRAMFTADLERCTEIEPTEWSQRRWWRKALSWLCYRFRRWL